MKTTVTKWIDTFALKFLDFKVIEELVSDDKNLRSEITHCKGENYNDISRFSACQNRNR